ncbi:MAG TPA: hypothetical protein VEY91_12585 [Candidatus Limnocylindria bacterium]|nr:hypothetical protein [Candidatus Limnocylindria bacterium]
MHASISRALGGALVVLALPWPIASHAQAPLDVSLTAHRVVVDARGRESLRPGDRAKPGELVEYRAAYRNAGALALRKVEATLPIPAGTEYLARSARPAPALASVDGQRFEPLPLKRLVRRPDGREELQEVPASEYRFLRWSLGAIEGRTTQTVRARVRVSSAVAAATAERR